MRADFAQVMREPRVGDVDRLGERDGDVGVEGDVDGPVRRARRGRDRGATSATRGVRLNSSTARPSSELSTLTSSQRTQTVAPVAIAAVVDRRPRRRCGWRRRCRSAAPTVGLGDRAGEVQAVDVGPGAGRRRLVASRLYWKSRRSGSARRRARAAQRPEPPLLAGVGDVEPVIVVPVLLVKEAPIVGCQRAGLQASEGPLGGWPRRRSCRRRRRCRRPSRRRRRRCSLSPSPSRGGTNRRAASVFVVPLLARLSKCSEAATPTAVSETEPVPAAGAGAAASGTSIVAVSAAVSPPAAARHLRAIRCPLRSSLPRKAVPRPVWFRAP